MPFNTSSLGSAKTFPGGRKDFKDFQELRHLVIEEQNEVDIIEEAPFGGPNGTYYAIPDNVPAEGLHGAYDRLSEIEKPKFSIDMGDDDEAETWYSPKLVLPAAGSEV